MAKILAAAPSTRTSNRVNEQGWPLRLVVLFIAVVTPMIAWADASIRGLWYETSGIDKEYLDANGQVNKYKKLGIDRLHIVITHKYDEMGLPCKCIKDAMDKKNFNEDVDLIRKIPELNKKSYRACRQDTGSFFESISPLKERRDEIRRTVMKCASGRHVFGLDKWPEKKFKAQGKPQLEEFVRELNTNGIEVVLTLWPAPTPRYVRSLSRLRNLIAKNKLNIYAIELEDEDNWSDDFVQDTEGYSFQDRNEAADKIFTRLNDLLPGMRVGVTTAPRHLKAANFSSDDHLLGHADFIALQAYHNICTRDFPYPNCNLANMEKDFAPGELQRKAIAAVAASGVLKDTSTNPNPKTLVLGLPAYDQDADPNLPATYNMYLEARVPLCEAGEIPIVEHSYWSGRNIAGHKRNARYAVPFLTNFTVDRLKGECGKKLGPENFMEAEKR